MEDKSDQVDPTEATDTTTAAERDPTAASEVAVEDAQPIEPAAATASPDAPADQDGPPPNPLSVVEAILFATDSPLTAARIAQVSKLAGQKLVKELIAQLNERYEQMGCAFRIDCIAGGYQMLTQPEFHDVLARLYRVRSETKLSPAAMETLAIIAYRQPILRADIEVIRGVASGEVLRGLMERQLVKIVGRAEVIGRPMLYGTTKKFLEVFGLAALEDLPRVEELRSGAKAPETTPDAATQPAAGSEQAAAPATDPTAAPSQTGPAEIAAQAPIAAGPTSEPA